MKTKRIIARILAVVIIITTVSGGSFMPVHAWKVGTHVYSANIIIDELKANNGSLEIAPFGKFRVDSGFVNAILNYPDYYRAGAMGPDVFPDIYVGQIVLHPGTSAANAGKLIETVLRRAMELPTSTSANMDPASFNANANSKGVLNIANKQQAIAFALGLTTHESGDLFGHSYVNKWAGGPWPDWAKEGVTQDGIDNVLRHNILESYIDKKIPAPYQNTEYNNIKIPVQFVYDTLVSNGRLAAPFQSSKDWSGVSVLYCIDDAHPVHFKLFYDIRASVGRKAAESEKYVDRHKNDKWPASIDPVLIYHRAREAYMEAWLEDIDDGLKAWVETGERVGRLLLQPGGMEKIKPEYDKWAYDHLLKMLGSPDVAAETISALGGVQKVFEETLPDAIKEQISPLKAAFANQLLRWAYSSDITNDKLSYEQLKAISKDPEQYMKNSGLFPTDAEAQILSDMGNFTGNSKAAEQTFAPFYNTLVMAKLNILTFDEGIRSLRYASGSVSTVDNGNNISLLADFPSMDVGYTWGKPEELAWFMLCKSQEDKTKIFDKIFQIHNSASVRDATLYNFRFASWGSQMGNGSGASVDYTLKEPKNEAKIGLYKQSEMFNPQNSIKSEAIPSGKVTGNYFVAVPFDIPGKYVICIYEGSKLLGTSEIFEANQAGDLVAADSALKYPVQEPIVLSNLRFGYSGAQPGSGINLNIDYIVKNNVNNAVSIGLYQSNDYQNSNKAIKCETLSGSQGSFSSTVPVGKPGKYAVYVLEGQSVLASSSVFEVNPAGDVITPDLTVLKNNSSGASQTGNTAPNQPAGPVILPWGGTATIPGGIVGPVKPGGAPITPINGGLTLPDTSTGAIEQMNKLSWTGVWETDFGSMILTRSGNEVTGVYSDSDYVIKGTVTGNSLKGTIDEGKDSKGEFEIALFENAQSFKGRYRYNGEEEWSGWYGKRISSLVVTQNKSSWTGIWYSDNGAVVLKQDGTKVSGIYAEEKYKLEGLIQGNILKGSFAEGDDKGVFEFTMHKDGGSFTGKYRYNGDEEWDVWSGIRKK